MPSLHSCREQRVYSYCSCTHTQPSRRQTSTVHSCTLDAGPRTAWAQPRVGPTNTTSETPCYSQYTNAWASLMSGPAAKHRTVTSDTGLGPVLVFHTCWAAALGPRTARRAHSLRLPKEFGDDL